VSKRVRTILWSIRWSMCGRRRARKEDEERQKEEPRQGSWADEHADHREHLSVDEDIQQGVSVKEDP
jgi:hypothetical protein